MGYLASSESSIAAALIAIAAEIATETTWSVLTTVSEGTGTRIILQKATSLETVVLCLPLMIKS